MNYQDCHACDIAVRGPVSPDDLHILFRTSMPWWADGMTKARAAFVRMFGLKTARADREKKLRRCVCDGTASDLLALPAKNENECVLLWPDKHLDAYVFIYMKKRPIKPKEFISPPR